MNKTRVLFVCLGNICRSPAAEGTFRHFVRETGREEEFHIDSAGTAAYHVGEPPNARAVLAAKKEGIVLEHRARRFTPDDFRRFDHIFAMDRSNFEDILSQAVTEEEKEKVRMYRAFDPGVSKNPHPPDVPDPYYGTADGFDHVQRILSRTSRSLLEWFSEQK